MKSIIFIAPPAAGKGTQSSKLENKYGYIHISTGDLLRKAIKEQTEIGSLVKDIIAEGKLVSDEIITTLLKEELTKINGHFILDGYPRNVNQAQKLDEILSELNIQDVVTIYLELSENDSMKRALGRIVCNNCNLSYNIYINELMPKTTGICDSCNEPLIQRVDDNEETFKVRFNTYLNETNPLLEYYKKKDMLKIVDSNATADVVFENIEQILTGERSNG